MRAFPTPLVALAACAAIVACTSPPRDEPEKAGAASPYLLISAGDGDGKRSDFLAVVDLKPGSPTLGKVVGTTPTGMKNSLPHHMEYAAPPAGEMLFMNAHHPETSMLVDVSNPRAPRVAKTFAPPAPLRFPHDYTRTPTGTRLVGFLRSEGKSIDTAETESPGNSGGFAEYSREGVLMRSVLAGNAGSVFFNSYGCAFYRLSEIDSDNPRLETFFALDTPPPNKPEPGYIRGACGIPIVFGHYWINTVGKLHALIVLDIADPAKPREVSRLTTPNTFNPHWLARDPLSNRLVLGAELGGEDGFYILRFDDQTGRLSFDTTLKAEGKTGYVSLKNQSWPHGATGPAWGHAALFLPDSGRVRPAK